MTMQRSLEQRIAEGIHDLELASFSARAKSIGMEDVAYFTIMRRNICNSLHAIRSNLAKRGIDPTKADPPDNLRDFLFTWFSENKQEGKADAVKLLTNAFPQLPAHLQPCPTATKELARRLSRKSPDRLDASVVSEILSKIPIMTSWSIVINAQVETRDFPPELPFVRLYNHLTDIFQAICYFLAGRTFTCEKDGFHSPDKLHFSTITTLDQHREILNDFIVSVLDMDQKRLNKPYTRMARFFTEASYGVGLKMFAGLMRFVILHEFSHVVLGHWLDTGYDPSVELAADELAFRALLLGTEGQARVTSFVGVRALFGFLSLMDAHLVLCPRNKVC